jgi:hypothetical protein
MADFTPKKVSTEKGAATGSLAKQNDVEHQDPPHMYLEHHHLEKLGLTKMPPVGSKIKVSGLAHVGATSENSSDGPSGGKAGGKGGEGNTRRSMTLHFHKMEMGTGKQGSDVADEEQSAQGAKAAMDKALSRELGGKKSKGSEGAEGKSGRADATPRGSNGPRGQA